MMNLPSIRSLHLPFMRNDSGSINPMIEPPPNFPKKIVFYGREYHPYLPNHILDNMIVVMNAYGERGLLFQAFNHTNDRPQLHSEIGNSRLFRALSSKDFPLTVLPFAALLSIQNPMYHRPKTIIYNGQVYFPTSGFMAYEMSLSVLTLDSQGPQLKIVP